MRSLILLLILSFIAFGCGGGEEDEFATGGGSGDVVLFNFDCDSPDVDCPGAAKDGDSWGDGVYEIKCAWRCALNTTEFKEPGFEDLTEPARHIVTFRKVGDNCWRVHDVDTDKCGKDIKVWDTWEQREVTQ